MSSYIIHLVDSDIMNSLNCKLKTMAEVMRLMNDPKHRTVKLKLKKKKLMNTLMLSFDPLLLNLAFMAL